MNAKIPVSVVVPVKNEEANLARCLSRVAAFAEVVVVDSGSTDASCEIASAHGAKVLQFAWNGRYPKKRNWVLLNHKLACDWVLFLDADELVDAPFCTAVRAAIEDDGCNGYWLNYTNHFLGRTLRHGVPQRKLALFRVGSGLYERVDEERWSGLDMEVHEHPVIDGRAGEISVPVTHLDNRGLARFIQRHLDYAVWEMHRARALRAEVARQERILTRRQVFKYRHMHKWWYPAAYFIYAYGLRLGFLDGAAGFHHACFKAWYFQTIRLLIKEQALGEAETGH